MFLECFIPETKAMLLVATATLVIWASATSPPPHQESLVRICPANLSWWRQLFYDLFPLPPPPPGHRQLTRILDHSPTKAEQLMPQQRVGAAESTSPPSGLRPLMSASPVADKRRKMTLVLDLDETLGARVFYK